MRTVSALRRVGLTVAVAAALAVPGLSPLSASATVTASPAPARAAAVPAATSTGVVVEAPSYVPQDAVGRAMVPVQIRAVDSTAGAVLTFSAAGLPPGLAISAGGVVSGTPSTGGQYSVTATATDQNGVSGSATFTWDAYGTITVSAPALTTVGVGYPVSVQVTATDSVPGQTVTFYQGSGGNVPGTLSMSPTGLITGTILQSSGNNGYFDYWVIATDGLGADNSYLIQFQAVLGPGPSAPGELKSAIGGKCLDDTGSGTADNNPVQLWSCTGDAAQQWQVDGQEITDFGKCLSTFNGGATNGTKAVLYSCQTTFNNINLSQLWSGDYATLFNDREGCLDDPNASQANGVKLQVWDCNERVQQNWTLPTGAMTSAISHMCADDTNASAANGTKVQLWTCNGQKSQQWMETLDNNIQIHGKCLDVVNNGTANGSKLQLWTCNNTPNQAWYTLPDGQIVNQGSGRCLDDPSATTKDGTRLQIWDCNASTQQSWRVP
jgi:hypothetical protein